MISVSTKAIKSNFAANIHYKEMDNRYFIDGKSINIFSSQILKLLGSTSDDIKYTSFQKQIEEYYYINPWYTEVFIKNAIENIYEGLKLHAVLNLPIIDFPKDKKIAVVLNPLSPFEGMGEILFVALCGFDSIVKIPNDSKALFEGLINFLGASIKGLSEKITFEDNRLSHYDAMIGINAFENETALKYISNKPNLLFSMKGCTVTLTGNESNEQLNDIVCDICRYFGRSFFSIKSLNVPFGYNFQRLFEAMEVFHDNAYNHRYFNHYEYHKSLLLINGIKHLDNGFMLLTPDMIHTGKTGVVTYTEYSETVSDIQPFAGGGKDHKRGLETYNEGLINGQVPGEARLFYNSLKIADFLSEL